MPQNSLYTKFDDDVKKRSRFKRALLTLDQLLNVLLWNGSQDETISSHIARRIKNNKAYKWEVFLCRNILRLLETNHCIKSLGE